MEHLKEMLEVWLIRKSEQSSVQCSSIGKEEIWVCPVLHRPAGIKSLEQ